MSRRKRVSQRRWKRRFLMGRWIPREAIENNPRLWRAVSQHPFKHHLTADFICRAIGG